MKIAVLGATGATGSVFTQMALQHGHHVIALVRNAAKLSIHKDAKLLKAVVGDALSMQDVSNVVNGADVVVSCLGHVPGGPCPMMSVAFANILTAAAQQSPVPRCVLMTTIGECQHQHPRLICLRFLSHPDCFHFR